MSSSAVSLVNHKPLPRSAEFLNAAKNCSGRILCNSCNTITRNGCRKIYRSPGCIYTMIHEPAEAARTSPFFPAPWAWSTELKPGSPQYRQTGSAIDYTFHHLVAGKTSADNRLPHGQMSWNKHNYSWQPETRLCPAPIDFREIVSTSCKRILNHKCVGVVLGSGFIHVKIISIHLRKPTVSNVHVNPLSSF